MGVNKSAGIVTGRWGATSFTSIRTVNGTIKSSETQISNSVDSVIGAGFATKRNWDAAETTTDVSNRSTVYAPPRPKKFFKSRDAVTIPQPVSSQSLQTNIVNQNVPSIHSNHGKCT